MKLRDLLRDVPVTGDAVLVTPKCTVDQLARVLVTAVTSLSDVLCHLPTVYVFRLAGGREGIVFSEPSPRPLIDLLVDLVGATEEPVRLEELRELLPLMRLSRAGIRVYPPLEDPAPGGLLH